MQLMKEIDKINPSIKLTMSHTSLSSEKFSSKCKCESDSIPFLDVFCSIKDDKFVTDLYRKESDRNQYLLTSSYHPVE
jgi:predicted SprT family Zn-dependent metalloprotease